MYIILLQNIIITTKYFIYSKIEGKDSYGNIGYELVTNDEVNIELSDVSSMENELKSFLNHEFPCVKINDVWNLINNLN
jgi:hypothetical protein